MSKMFRYTPKKKPGVYENSNMMKKEESYGYVKDHDTNSKGSSYGKDKDGPPGYEGKEHVKYRDPGYTRHEIEFPEDEPHMKSRVGKEEMHEMEDNYHMETPDQTHYDLEKKIKRARMDMDSHTQEDPKPLRGNLIRDVSKGIEDTSGDEEEGPNDMQSDEKMPKEHRKKMIASVLRKKMKRRMPGSGENDYDKRVMKAY